MRGMEVDTVESAGADWTDVVVGRVLEVRRHPNADTLWLARVDVGEAGGELDIVCGAQNLEVGQLVPTALVGAVLPGDRRIERTKIRGEVSHGMLCSAAELGLGTDADGIHILGRDDELALGSPLADIVGETVLDVDVKPNRGDALSMVGLAREIAAFTGAPLRLPDATVHETDDDAAAHVSVRIEDPELNPRFVARWFDGVANGPSPEWMQRRLIAAGMRPISAVVDVTNYVMHELGQPMHAYDADAVPGGEIVVRRGRAGRAAPDDRPPRARARRADAGHRRPRAADRPGRDHGRRVDRGGGGHDAGHPRVGDLPRADHPQHRPPPRPALGGQHAPREGDRARPAALRRRPRGEADRRDHRRAGRARPRGQRPGAEAAAPGGGRGAAHAPAPRVRPRRGARPRAARAAGVRRLRRRRRPRGGGALASARRRRRGRRGRGGRARPWLRADPRTAAAGGAAAVSAGPERAAQRRAPHPRRAGPRRGDRTRADRSG